MNSTLSASATTTADDITARQIEDYRAQGFVRVPNLLAPDEVARFREAALQVSASSTKYEAKVFQQLVNVWRENETMRELTLNARIGAIAEKLSGQRLRLWHDQILIKKPHNNAPTMFHQDKPYWPHGDSPHPISCWIALVDVPVERGCMTFLPGSQSNTGLKAQDLNDAGSLFGLAPELRWQERVTVPLRAGDCTFHHGLCAHMANPNDTDEARVAHAIIYMNANTTLTSYPHIVTDPLGMEVGQVIEGEMFPAVADFE